MAVRLLLATTNPGKLREFRRILPVEMDDLSAYRAVPVVEETGRTFMANACLKASYYAIQLNAWTLADDSGLAVDALAGAPGIHSARWAAMYNAGSGDAANNALLLRQLDAVLDPQRTARFVCTLALSDPQGRIVLTATDWVAGHILRRERGHDGFGYDPLFWVESHGRTTAELAPAEKDAISHRGNAARKMLQLLNRLSIPGLGQALSY
jgi:XTP/dITP diphosphohydrolase